MLLPLGGTSGASGTSGGTWNPADKGANITLSGYYMTAIAVPGGWNTVRATISRDVALGGKGYFEVYVPTTDVIIGVATADASTTSYIGFYASGWGYYSGTGEKFHNTPSGTAYGNSFSATAVIGVAVDCTAAKIWFSKNGTWQASGDPATGTGAAFGDLAGTIFPAASIGSGSSVTLRLKSTSWSYAAPSGFSEWPGA